MKQMVSVVKKSSLISLVVIFMLSFLLSACGMGIAETHITVYPNKYKLATVISITADQMQMAGGPKVFEEMLDEEVSSANGDVEISWRDVTERNSGVYRYELSTGMIDYTNDYTTDFTWRETEFNNRKAYEFRYSELASIMSSFQSLTITLHAGKILDSNGTQLDKGTVTWVDPSVVPYAIVVPKGSTNWVFLIIVIAIIMAVGFFIIFSSLIIGSVVLFFNKKKKTTQSQKSS